jgi:hypothetical protein
MEPLFIEVPAHLNKSRPHHATRGGGRHEQDDLGGRH